MRFLPHTGISTHFSEFELKIVGHDFQQGDMEEEGGARIEGILPPNCIFSYAQIVLSSVEDFSELLNNYLMTENEKEEFKYCRRKGKNRLCAMATRGNLQWRRRRRNGRITNGG